MRRTLLTLLIALIWGGGLVAAFLVGVDRERTAANERIEQVNERVDAYNDRLDEIAEEHGVVLPPRISPAA